MYGDRLAQEAMTSQGIRAAILQSGCELQQNARPATGTMLELCPTARLMRFFPDYRFRWPESEWGLIDFKSSGLIELAAWATYVDLRKLLGERHVIIATPYGWQPIEDLRLSRAPEGGFRLAGIRGEMWACPRLDGSHTNGGSDTPFSSSISKPEPYSRWNILRAWLAKSPEITEFERVYGQAGGP